MSNTISSPSPSRIIVDVATATPRTRHRHFFLPHHDLWPEGRWHLCGGVQDRCGDRRHHACRRRGGTAARGTPRFCYLAHRSRHVLSSVSVDGGAVGIEI